MAARRPDIETCLLIERVILERNVSRRKSIDVPAYSVRVREKRKGEGEKEKERKRGRERPHQLYIAGKYIYDITRLRDCRSREMKLERFFDENEMKSERFYGANKFTGERRKSRAVDVTNGLLTVVVIENIAMTI